MTHEWEFDTDAKEWNLKNTDGHVRQDSDGRFLAYLNGARIGSFLSETVAKQAVEHKAE
jgi:hypothetical protein